MAVMKERPILFSGEMVRAILEERKTQTRRVINPQPAHVWGYGVRNGEDVFSIHMRAASYREPDIWLKCPYGKVGDQLWVRETFTFEGYQGQGYDERAPSVAITYHATDTGRYQNIPVSKKIVDELGEKFHRRKRPSIYMPRWASRITIEVTRLSVERVQDISERDAANEGCSGDIQLHSSARNEFAKLWNSINAKRGYSWESNPCVWVVEFKVVR
jgi:hypothetical protein